MFNIFRKKGSNRLTYELLKNMDSYKTMASPTKKKFGKRMYCW